MCNKVCPKNCQKFDKFLSLRLPIENSIQKNRVDGHFLLRNRVQFTLWIEQIQPNLFTILQQKINLNLNLKSKEWSRIHHSLNQLASCVDLYRKFLIPTQDLKSYGNLNGRFIKSMAKILCLKWNLWCQHVHNYGKYYNRPALTIHTSNVFTDTFSKETLLF